MHTENIFKLRRSALHAALRELKSRMIRGEAVPIPEHGICRNVVMVLNLADNGLYNSVVSAAIADISVTWPEYSGNVVFPIRHPVQKFVSPCLAYINASERKTMWDIKDTYGAARLSLLNYLLRQTR